MKRSVSVHADEMPAGILKLLDALEPADIEEMARLGTALNVFAGIGRALFTAKEAAEEYRQQQRAAPAAPPPATVIDYRSTPAVEPAPAPVQEIPAEPLQEQVAAEREEIGNRLPIAPRTAERTTGAAEENRRRIAKLLVERGPMRAGEIAPAVGLSDALVAYYLKRPDWYQKTDPSNRLSPWAVTATALAAIGADPRPEESAPPSEPQPEPERPAPEPVPPAVDPDDPKAIARQQVLAIARAIASSPGCKATRERIAAVADLEEVIVKNRLRAGGPNASLPAFTYFSRTEQSDGTVLWGLTHNGAALVREAGDNPQKPSGA